MKLFVYGTLMKEERNHHYLRESEYLGKVTTNFGYGLVSLGLFPAMFPLRKSKVKGELYDVTKEELNWIDRLEGHPNFYRRVFVRLEDLSWVAGYMLPRIMYKSLLIGSGDWKEFQVKERTHA